MLNNGSALVAAGNAMRVLGFKGRQLAPAPQATPKPAPASVVRASRSTPDCSEALSLSALSKRLGIAHQSITARRKRGDFATWIQSLDPSGYSWDYCDRSNTYRRAIA
jgi:hypothetical protein